LVFKIIIAASYFCYLNPFKSPNFVVMPPLNKVFQFLGSCLKSKEMAICNSLAILKCKKISICTRFQAGNLFGNATIQKQSQFPGMYSFSIILVICLAILKCNMFPGFWSHMNSFSVSLFVWQHAVHVGHQL
jgi:hypothetical protein